MTMGLAGRKVLVTGADGFIGSHLVERLVDEGCDVTAFVLYNSFGTWGWLDRVPAKKKEKVKIFAGDIRDSNGVRVSMEGTSVLFHLAALIGIPFSYHSPDSYVDTNIRGTLNALQAARDLKLDRVLVTSTSEVYGTAKYVPIDEAHPRQAQSPYSATKVGADALADSFFRSFGTPVTIVRPFNTYGPRQSARAIIPTIITQLLSGEKRIQIGDLRPTRDFVFVRDTVEAFIEVANSNSLIGEEVNVATGVEISIADLAAKLISMTGMNAEVNLDTQRLRPADSEVFRLLGSCEKLKKNTHWKQTYSLDEGLAETIKWFSHGPNREAYKSHLYNV